MLQGISQNLKKKKNNLPHPNICQRRIELFIILQYIPICSENAKNIHVPAEGERWSICIIELFAADSQGKVDERRKYKALLRADELDRRFLLSNSNTRRFTLIAMIAVARLSALSQVKLERSVIILPETSLFSSRCSPYIKSFLYLQIHGDTRAKLPFAS